MALVVLLILTVWLKAVHYPHVDLISLTLHCFSVVAMIMLLVMQHPQVVVLHIQLLFCELRLETVYGAFWY